MAAIQNPLRLAIQGESGSNSHMAALVWAQTWPARPLALVACASAAEVFEQLAAGAAELALLPIENSLHGSVLEHYDLLLEHGAHAVGESSMRIGHNVIVAPGVRLAELRRVRSHPVALSQCRRWLRAHPEIVAEPCYDTAGSVKQMMLAGDRSVAGIAPVLAAEIYGAEVLVAAIEDHAENYTRFLLLSAAPPRQPPAGADKMSVAFALQHRPGTLLSALAALRGLNLTKIESRPVAGRPWEYVFFVDVRFARVDEAEQALAALGRHCEWTRVLGMYPAAG